MFLKKPKRTGPMWLMLVFSTVAVGLQLFKILPLSFAGLVLITGFLYVVDRPTLRSVGNYRFWLTGLVLAALSGMLLGKQYETFYGMNISPDGLKTGVMIVIRAAVLVSVIFSLSSRISADQLVRVFARAGVPQTGAAVALGMKLMPQMVRDWKADAAQAGSGKILDRTARMLAHAANLSDEIARDSEAWMAPRHEADIFCVTGSIGSGKSRYLENLVESLTSQGLKVGGFIQKSIYEGDLRLGYDLLMYPGPEAIPLARMKTREEGRGWNFDDAAFDSAKEHLKSLEDVDVFIVDELGWIEQAGRGHWPSVARFLPLRGGIWILSCRLGLMETFVSRLGYMQYESLTLPADGETDDEFQSKILNTARSS